jgi:hypothetical protein
LSHFQDIKENLSETADKSIPSQEGFGVHKVFLKPKNKDLYG